MAEGTKYFSWYPRSAFTFIGTFLNQISGNFFLKSNKRDKVLFFMSYSL